MATATDTQANGQPETVEALSLPQKILAVARSIEDIEKDGHNDHQNYDFASAENILRKVRGPLAEHGVLLLSDLDEITERPIKTAKGKDSTITTVKVRFTLIDTESDAELEKVWAGTGDDPSDKGIYKAYTGALKTFLRVTFLLPLGEDPEADKRADERTEDNGNAQANARKLPADKVAPLMEAVEKAGLTDHLTSKLRGFGVDKLEDLTVEQAVALYEWTQASDG